MVFRKKKLYPSFGPILSIFYIWQRNLDYVTTIYLVGVNTSQLCFLLNVLLFREISLGKLRFLHQDFYIPPKHDPTTRVLITVAKISLKIQNEV